jgi:hypothetical protein
MVPTNAPPQSRVRAPVKRQRIGGHEVRRALRQRTKANGRTTFPAKTQARHRVVATRQEDVGVLSMAEGLRNVPLAVKVNPQVVTEEIIPGEGEGVPGVPVIRLCPEPLGAARPGNYHPVGQPIEPSIHINSCHVFCICR